MMDAKVTILDTLQFCKSVKVLHAQCEGLYQKFQPEFLRRFEDLEKRIGESEDLNALEKFHRAKEDFLKPLAEVLDVYRNTMAYMVTGFEGIDRDYWRFVIDGQKLQSENEFQKITIANLMKQNDLMLNGWRGERRKWNERRVLMKVS